MLFQILTNIHQICTNINQKLHFFKRACPTIEKGVSKCRTWGAWGSNIKLGTYILSLETETAKPFHFLVWRIICYDSFYFRCIPQPWTAKRSVLKFA